MDKNQLVHILEAVIFASDSPLSLAQLQAIVPDVPKEMIEEALTQLSRDLEDRAIFLKKVAGGYQFATRPEYWRWIKQMYIGKERTRLTRAALETLAIIAFKQPVSKAEISAIRGVNVDGVVKNLLERNLITISGRDEGPGRPLLFSTTKYFLQFFGINDISDLPKPKEIEELLAQGEGERIIQEIHEEALLQEVLAEDQQTEEVDEQMADSDSPGETNLPETTDPQTQTTKDEDLDRAH